ncbi:AAA family ATPase [Actinomadura graeca]|uniref:AAA family ATPase n=1 Tax=Actinomadura graeca TaxID=2750812 RepID=A0ABX8R8M4_9ACTN|nr:LuxR family transcriptional regulator [Actinomadura graeca]QXJ26127.1 AAA family ATPase [Actinomadura graeca]
MSPVKRNEEVAVLEELLTDSLLVRSRVAVISGGVATGKSSLLCSLERRARESGAIVLGAVASPLETGLPVGVLEQLFSSPELPDAMAERATRLLNSHRLPLLVWFRGMWDLLRGLTEHRPVVIGVDDVHHADETSLRCLLYLVRRLRSARLLTVLTERTRPHTAKAPLHTEFLHEPHSRLIELGPMSAADVADLLRSRFDAGTARRLAPALHETSAGNPALVEALLEDYAAGPQPLVPEGLAGRAFGRAVVGFLRRHEFPVLDAARALAVLNKPLPPRLLGMLLDIDAESAARAVATLASAGVLHGGRFRHGVAQAAVADGMPAGERRDLHLRAAQLLHSEGAAAAEVAEHIVASNHGEPPWALPTLREAAEQALIRDDLDTGIRYLRAAHQMCGDERRRAVIAAVLADAEWRVDPTMVLRRLPECDLAIRENLLDERYATAPLTSLMWQGRLSEALRTVGTMLRNGLGAQSDEHPAVLDLIPLQHWPSYLYPELLPPAWPGDAVQPGNPVQPGTTVRHGPLPHGPARPGTIARPAPPSAAAPPSDGGDHAEPLLVTRLRRGDIDGALGAAERILERSRLSEQTFVPLSIALGTLVYGARPARSAPWCDLLVEEAATRRSPTWLALFTALRSLIDLRQGDLAGAGERAETAWNLIPRKGWGVVAGLPLSCMIQVWTSTGRHDDAAALLETSVPEAMFRTPMGQHYYYARGRHHLAAKRYHAALYDFRACGSMRADASIEPWRLGAAQTLLALGREPREARRLADEQLALVSPIHLRTRGMSLRVKAATLGLPDRRPLLERSAELLERYGDRLELAHTLRDLGDLHSRTGGHERARELGAKADALARQCGIPCRAAPPDGDEGPGVPGLRLSDAERRVASLAADGYTNREISKKLYITISTVEQHLTNTYRKLNVKRFDLKGALQAGEIVLPPSGPALGTGGRHVRDADVRH